MVVEGPTRQGSAIGAVLVTILVVGLGTLATGLFALGLLHAPGDVLELWPTTAFAAVVIARRPSSHRFWGLSTFACANAAANALLGGPAKFALLVGMTGTLEAALGVACLTWLARRHAGPTPRHVLSAIFLVGGLVPVVGGVIGGLVITTAIGGTWVTNGLGWWLACFAGAAVVLPIAFSATRERIAALCRGRAAVETAGLFLLAAAMVWATGVRVHQPVVFLLAPILLAAVLRGALASALVGAVTVTGVLALARFGGLDPSSVTISDVTASAIVGNVLPFCVGLLIEALREEREKIAASEVYFRDAMNHSPFGMALLRLDGTCFSVNRAVCDLLGYAPEELIGRHPADLSHPDDAIDVAPRLEALLRGEIPEVSLEKRYQCRDGSWVWVFVAVSAVRDERTGEPVYMIAQLQDIEARRRAEQALEVSESRWNFALESAGQGVWDYDYVRREVFYSPVWASMLGYRPGDLPCEADGWLALVHPHDLPRLLRQEQQHLAGETEQFECEFRMRHKEGHWLWVLDRGKVIARDAAGRPLRMIGTHTDITEYRRLTDALQEEKERLRTTLHSIGDGVICTDSAGLVTFINPIAEQLTGWTASAAMNRPSEVVFRVREEGTDVEARSPVTACLAELERVSRDEGLVLVGRSGARVDIEASASPVRKPSGEVLGTVLVFQDVTRARTLQKELAQLASHDALTGLKNRSSFELALHDLCREATAHDSSHALCFLDLDRFKIINDTAGHAAGDVLLREIGRLIREQMRRGDLVARLGGDEFGILIADCPLDEATRIADRLIERINRVRFSWNGRVYEIGASIGIARLDRETPLASDAMSRADVACYAAKAAGRNRVSVYHPSEGDARRHHTELHTAAGIRAALEADRFAVFAQEILDLRPSGRLQRHVELLVRMYDDQGQLLTPGAFIPAAERYGLMASIDRWMIRQVLHGFDRAVLAVPHLTVSINLSANSLEDPGLLQFLAEELESSALPPHRIRFEITETSLINNLTHAGRLVEDLRNAGYAIMLDDFGAGVSSFAYLEKFPVDFLKIDGGFVRKMVSNPIDRAIVESINDIGHKIGAVTIAEFVENAETLAILGEIGIDMAQGYHIGRPIPLADMLAEMSTTEAPRATAGAA